VDKESLLILKSVKKELEDLIISQSVYHGFNKYSKPKIESIIEYLTQIIEGKEIGTESISDEST